MQQSSLSDANNSIMMEGDQMTVRLNRTSPTTATITWTLPPQPDIYNGALVVMSRTEINPSNFPTDGEKYTGSADWSTPTDQIGTAHVVGAFYNDMVTTSVNVTNLVADDIYFVTVHLITNVRQYHTSGVATYSSKLRPIAYARAIEQDYAPPTAPTPGQHYFNVETKTLYRWSGTAWETVPESAVKTGYANPATGEFIGDLFYNIQTKRLMVWNGTIWDFAEPDQPSTMTDRFNVGTDLTSTERENMIDVLKTMMGFPVVCVELTAKHYNIAINNAIEEFRHRADNAYHRQFISMPFKAGQQTYYLNDPQSGTNRVVDVLKIHRLNFLGLAVTGNNGIYAQQFLSLYFQPGPSIDLVSVHLIHQLSETFSQLFVGDVGFVWRETTRELTIMRRLFNDERFLLECSMEKTEQELLKDRWASMWIQDMALSECLMMLSQIRGKYATLPGPGGGLSLNAADLYAQSETIRQECLRSLQDMEVGNGTAEFGNYSFVIG